MKTPIKIEYEVDDGRFIFEDWSETGGYLQITYKEDDTDDAVLPVMDKVQWERFKRLGDFVFEESID